MAYSNENDMVGYAFYQKIEHERNTMIAQLEALGIKYGENAKSKAINIKYLEQKLTDEVMNRTITSDVMAVFFRIIGEWKR